MVLDQDVLIRTNIMHWLLDDARFPPPCATQAKDNIEWNSGAMVISPNERVFDFLVQQLGRVQKYESAQNDYHYSLDMAHIRQIIQQGDSYNSGHGHQGYLSSIFTAPDVPHSLRLHTMPVQSALLVSRLKTADYEYWSLFRSQWYETIHLSVAKPWDVTTATARHNPIVCRFLHEWNVTMAGIERYNISYFSDQYLANCPIEDYVFLALHTPQSSFWDGFDTTDLA